MIDTVRLHVLIGIQSALLGETVPSLYAVTFTMSKPNISVYWHMDSEITDEIEDHFFGFVADLYDQIPENIWETWELHHTLEICSNDSELSDNVVYLRRTNRTVTFNSAVMSVNTDDAVCIQTKNQIMICHIPSKTIRYYDIVSGDKYFVENCVWMMDNKLSLVYPIRPMIADEKLHEKFIYEYLKPSTSSASADWLLLRIKASVILQKILLGTILPMIYQVWVKVVDDKVDVVLYADNLTNNEVQSSQRCISALLCAEFPQSETSCLLKYSSKNEVLRLHDPWFLVYLAPRE